MRPPYLPSQKTIKFSKCPLPGRHYGYYWQKLFRPPVCEAIEGKTVLVHLKELERMDVDDMSIEEIQADTFPDMTREEFNLLIKGMTGSDTRDIHGILLHFEYGDLSGDRFTTFRSYNPNKMKYYLDGIGHDFKVDLGDVFRLRGLEPEDRLFLKRLPANKDYGGKEHGF